jgi:SAM-dependent methyltransferase
MSQEFPGESSLNLNGEPRIDPGLTAFMDVPIQSPLAEFGFDFRAQNRSNAPYPWFRSLRIASGSRALAKEARLCMQSEQFRLNYDVEQTHWWFVARRRILRQLIREVLPPARDTMIVDVGCGTGANIGSLAGDYDCLGIDPTAEAIDLARSRFPTCRYLCGSAPEDLGQLAGQAKLFLMTDVLEHVEDDFALLSRLMAAASPGAYFLLTVPADLSLWSPHDESHGHYRRYDQQRFERLWADMPVSPLLVAPFNYRLYPLVKMIRMLNRWRGKASGAANTDLKVPPRRLNSALENFFAGEQTLLRQILTGGRAGSSRHGVSLIALLRRRSGQIAPRAKPAELPGDYYNPATRQYLSIPA